MAADNRRLNLIGEFDATLQCGDRTVTDTIHVLKGTKDMYISWYASRDLGFLREKYPKQVDDVSCIAPYAVSDEPVINKPNSRITVEDLVNEFHEVFDGKLRTMPGEEFRIKLEDEAVPFCVKTPRAIPYAYREQVKKQLDQMVDQGIIQPVKEPTDWCSPIVVAPKKGTNDIRLCIDFTKLNKFVRRERYQSPTPHEAVADIAATKAKYFTTVDALSGYWQCPLEQDSQLLTCFIIPFGRFKFTRAPFGLCSISEHYNRRMDEALRDIPHTRTIVDDLVAYDESFDDHVAHVRKILKRCADKGISLKRSKFIFAQPEASFFGYILSGEGYRSDPSLVKAIAEFPIPQNITDLRSFFGLANQLGSFTDHIAESLEPLRSLLKSKNEFIWDNVHNIAFQKAKKVLSDTPILAYYDPTKEASPHVDASRLKGNGFVLKQKQSDGTWRFVQAGSRFLTETETRYAMIEIELLGILWAVKKCRLFLEGLSNFEVVTDHRPLIPIINGHRLDEIENPRLQRLRMQLMNYKLFATWCSGKKHIAADALSRSPVMDPQPDDELAEQDVNFHLHSISKAVRDDSEMDIRLNEIHHAARNDDKYQELLKNIKYGFPYRGMRDQLSVDDGLILCGCPLVIPRALRRKYLSQLHDSHQGIARTRERARLISYWPLIDKDIERVVRACKKCEKSLPSHVKEPLLSPRKPTRIFEHLSADLFSYGGRNFLVVTDIKSGWPTTHNLGRNICAKDIVTALRDTFRDTAVPTVLYSDGGPQFASRFTQEFLREWGVRSVISSPHYPQSNGHAEISVKAMKKLITNCWDTRTRNVDMDKWAKGLLQWRNTHRIPRQSPAQVVFGHPACDTLPIHKRAFAKHWQHSVKNQDCVSSKHQETVERHYNLTARPLPPLQCGNKIVIQNHCTKKWDT